MRTAMLVGLLCIARAILWPDQIDLGDLPAAVLLAAAAMDLIEFFSQWILRRREGRYYGR
jgi:hypothetical protein